MSNADDNKRAAAEAAYRHVRPGEYLGMGTGTTVDHFIDVLAERKPDLPGCVSSSQATGQRLRAAGFDVVDLNSSGPLLVYVDGADEVDRHLHLIKGGRGALTREKIVASAARKFVCMVEASKRVDLLGAFGLPVEVIEMARSTIARAVVGLGGHPELRAGFVSDNGHPIIDVHGLKIVDPIATEDKINAMPGVVTVGLFARRGADVLIVGDQGRAAEITD